MTADRPENEPSHPQTADVSHREASSETIQAQALASSILTACVRGGDVRTNFANLAAMPDSANLVDEYIATALVEHIALLTETQHWMTLAQGTDRDLYVNILRKAREKVTGIDRLTIGTKLADTLRRIGGASLSEAETILTEDMHGLEYGTREPESCRALSAAYYTLSFIPRDNHALGMTPEERKLYQSLSDLVTSAERAREGLDAAGEAQSQIRFCGVQLDNAIGDPKEILRSLMALVETLQDVEGTWGQRFLRNALGRRVEAAAKSNDYHWQDWYTAYIALPGIEQHCGGEETFAAWKAKYNPSTPRGEKESS